MDLAATKVAKLLRSVVEAGASDSDLLQLKGFGEACLRDARSAASRSDSLTWEECLVRPHLRRVLSIHKYPNRQLPALLTMLSEEEDTIAAETRTLEVIPDSAYSMQCQDSPTERDDILDEINEMLSDMTLDEMHAVRGMLAVVYNRQPLPEPRCLESGDRIRGRN